MGGKAIPSAPAFPQALFDLPGHLALGKARGEFPGHLAHHGFGQRQGPAHDGQLGPGLPLAQAFHQPFRGLPGDREPRVGHFLGQALVLPVGEMRRFKTQAAHLEVLEEPRQGFRQVDFVDDTSKSRASCLAQTW